MRTCASCGEHNPVQARFCSRCGNALGSNCDRCGAELIPGARFCSSCGVAVATPSIPSPTEVLKVITVLFADVVGSTERAELMHPEDTRALMTDFFRAMTEEIEHEGGTVERIIGDGIMADFGWPTAHEDDPERAVRAALAMLIRLDKWNVDKESAQQIQIRIGINTGEVSAAGAPGQDLLVTGDPVNVAARLEQSAEPGTVLVGERTARAIRRSFDVVELEPLVLKGKRDRVACYRVIAPRAADAADQMTRAALVGRDVELATLVDVFRRTARTGVPHVMTLVGDAGVGKSRLTEELAGLLESEARILRGRCLPYGDGVTLWPLREILENLSGAQIASSPSSAVTSIEGFVREVLIDVTDDPKRTAAALATTLGLEPPEMKSLDPRARQRELIGAWRCLLTRLARDESLLLLIEDAHWADDLVLDILEDLSTHVEGAVLFLASARPDLFERRANWGAGVRNSMTLQLEPLPPESTTDLLQQLLNGAQVPPSVTDLVLERCEGNPFFAQEVLRQLVDAGALIPANGSWTTPAALAELDLPDNIYGVLSARLDLLSDEERAVAQAAAVIGRGFWQGAVEALTGAQDLSSILRKLERRHFITERPRSSIPGDVEFSFTHILIRDVAYQTMPRRTRAQMHDRFAQWLEQTKGARATEFAELLAHHYFEAYEIAGSENLREKARSYSLTASRTALTRFAVKQAKAFGQRTVELSTSGPERIEALEALGDLSINAYAIDDAWTSYTVGLSEARSLGHQRPSVRLAAKAAITATRYEGAMKKAPSAAEISAVIDEGLSQVPDEMARERCLLLASKAFGQGVGYQARESSGVDAGTLALRLAEELDDAELLSIALDAKAFWLFPESRYAEMQELEERRVALAPRLTNITEICDAYGSACWACFFVGRFRKTVEYATESLRRAEGVDAGNFAHALQWRVIAQFSLGEWDRALEDQARLESFVADDTTIPVYAAGAYSTALLCHELRGHDQDVRQYLARLERLRLEQEAAGDEIFMPRAATALALLHRGDIEGARSWISLEKQLSLGMILEALCQIAARGDLDEATRVSVLATKENARMGSPTLRAHAERLRGLIAIARGDRDEGAALLRASARTFEDLGAVWDEAVSLLTLGEELLEGSSEIERSLQRAQSTFERLGARAEADRATAALALL